jgi:hypothetical protein
VFYDHLVKLLRELNVEGAQSLPRETSTITLEIGGTPIAISDAPPGLELSATLGEVPVENPGPLYTKLLRGNFLGQATKKAALGLDTEAKNVVLSAAIPAIRSYREFRDTIEDFVNAVSFWKKEITT